MKDKILRLLFFKFFALKRHIFAKILSDKSLQGKPQIAQPTLFLGQGKIIIDNSAHLGYFPSPHFYSNYMHIEARSKNAIIKIGKNVFINNNATIVSDGAGIEIGDNCLIGPNFTCFDSDFHTLNPKERLTNPKPKAVKIANNVFIGANVTILKGVEIGQNSVIGGGFDK